MCGAASLGNRNRWQRRIPKLKCRNRQPLFVNLECQRVLAVQDRPSVANQARLTYPKPSTARSTCAAFLPSLNVAHASQTADRLHDVWWRQTWLKRRRKSAVGVVLWTVGLSRSSFGIFRAAAPAPTHWALHLYEEKGHSLRSPLFARTLISLLTVDCFGSLVVLCQWLPVSTTPEPSHWMLDETSPSASGWLMAFYIHRNHGSLSALKWCLATSKLALPIGLFNCTAAFTTHAAKAWALLPVHHGVEVSQPRISPPIETVDLTIAPDTGGRCGPGNNSSCCLRSAARRAACARSFVFGMIKASRCRFRHWTVPIRSTPNPKQPNNWNSKGFQHDERNYVFKSQITEAYIQPQFLRIPMCPPVAAEL